MRRKDHLSICYILILTFFIAFIGIPTASAANLSSISYQKPPNPYNSPQCTWYAWGRVNEVTGISLPNWGNAQDWYSNAANQGYSVGATPQIGAVVVWQGIGSEVAGVGHVAYVESIPDSTHIHISEGNFLGEPYHEDTVLSSSGSTSNPGSIYEGRLTVYIYFSAHNRIATLTPDGNLYVKEGSLDAEWVKELTGVAGMSITSNRIGALTKDGTYFVKEGGLDAPWVSEMTGVVQGVLSGNRIGVLMRDGTFFVKEGGLDAPWVNEMTGVAQGSISGNRIGALTKDGTFFVKEGGLDASWVSEMTGVVQGLLSGNRIGVLMTDGTLFVKEGGLGAPWVNEMTGVALGSLSGNRIGVLMTDGTFFVKEGGLDAPWVNEMTGVALGSLSGNRIGVLMTDGTLFVKEGGLDAKWVQETSIGDSKLATLGNIETATYYDATLKTLIPSSGTLNPSFSAGNLNYIINLANNVSSISLTPTVNESHATVKVNGVAVTSGKASGSISLVAGVSEAISVFVTAQNGATKTYTVTVSRAIPDTQAVTEFVTRFYQQCLDRYPDQTGLDYWVDILLSGEQTGADVAQGFVFSNEFVGLGVSNEEYLDILYSAFFNREPDTGGYDYWLGQLNGGASRLVVLAGFVNANEFGTLCDDYGITRGSIDTSDEQIAAFVTRFYEECLGRQPDQAGLDYWVEQLTVGTKTGADVAYGFVYSNEFQANVMTDAEYLDVLFTAFFNREADGGGLTYWLGELNGGTSRLEVLAGFVNSNEFAALCSDYGIEAGEII